MTEELQAKIATLESGRLRDAIAIEATRQGMVDLGDLAHVALEGVELQSDGTIKGAKEFVEKLKGSKAHWFAKPDNASVDRDRLGRSIPKVRDVIGEGIKPGSPEHKKIQQEYMERHSR